MNQWDYFLNWARQRIKEIGDESSYSEVEIEYMAFCAGIEYAKCHLTSTRANQAKEIKMFICPGRGVEVDENEDLIVCDDCFQEAAAIRAIRSQLVGIDIDSLMRYPSIRRYYKFERPSWAES